MTFLQVQGNRPFVVKGTINNLQTTYAGNICVGGLITLSTGLPPGTILTSVTLRIKARQADFTTPQSIIPMWFDANPTGSTIVDNSAVTIVAADIPKCILTQAAAAALQSNGVSNSMYLWGPVGPRMAVDGSGNIYFAFLSALSSLVFASTNVLYYELDGTS